MVLSKFPASTAKMKKSGGAVGKDGVVTYGASSRISS